MGRSFQVFLQDRPDVWTVLEPLGWTQAPDESSEFGTPHSFELEGDDWLAQVWAPTPMSAEDAPTGVSAVQSSLSWHVGASLQGETGLPFVIEAMEAIAKAGSGAVADEGVVWKPGRAEESLLVLELTETTGLESEFLAMTWWTVRPVFANRDDALGFLETLNRVLPEAIPVRWGGEPPAFRLEDEGLEGLARFIEHSSDSDVLGTTRSPISEFQISKVFWPPDIQRSDDPPSARSLKIEVGGSVLADPAGARRLSDAFRELSRATRPFYAEARLERGVTWGSHGERGRAEVPPLEPMRWVGFPRVAPMAMVVGPPYTAHWHDQGGAALHDMVIYSSQSWPDPPPGGVPVAAEDLLQEFDLRRVFERLPPSERLRKAVPMSVPPTWPFQRGLT